MSDREAEVLRRFVAEGGGLVATGLCGAKDERGLDRPGFAIADVLGVDLLGHSGDIFDRYLRVDAGHPVTAEFKPGDLLPQLGRTLVEAREGAQVVATSVENSEAAGPGLVVNTFGKGRVAYSPSNLASTYADP